MEGKTTKKLILVQIASRQKSDYYIVDLEAKKIERAPFETLINPLATLINEDGEGSTLCLGSVLYTVGGKISTDYFCHKTTHVDHLGASCLELNIPHLLSLVKGQELQDDEDVLKLGSNYNKWKPIPAMHYGRKFAMSAPLGGRIYVLGGAAPCSCVGEVFIPQQCKWKPLAPPPSNLHLEWNCVSYPVIPDEKNERLLVHFRKDGSLYAYYPATQEWDCLAKNFRCWKKPAALADDVLYIQHRGKCDCLVAYDLLTKVWLDVKYSFDFTVDIRSFKFLNMLYLGNGTLCLAHCVPFYDAPSRQTNLQFIKFRVERLSPRVVRVSPIAVHCFPFEGYVRASRPILL